MNDRLQFWSENQSWPRDPVGYIYLARAVNQIGKATFGNEWSGADPGTKLPQLLPSKGSATVWEKIRAHDLIESQFPNRPTRKMTGPLWARSAPDFSDDEWTAAQAIVADLQCKAIPSCRRFSKVRETIIRECEAGQLTAAYRAHDGSMQEVPRQHWNGNNLENRFVICLYNPGDPFSIGFSGDRFLEIFVTSNSLKTILQRLARGESQDSSATEEQDGDARKFYEIPAAAPKGGIVARAHKLLLAKFPNRQWPVHISAEQVAKDLSNSRLPGSKPEIFTREAVLRAAGRKQ
jgi:hypothetical protein